MIAKGSRVKLKATGELGLVSGVLPSGVFQIKLRKPVIDKKTGKPRLTPYGDSVMRLEKIEASAAELELVRASMDGSKHSEKGLETLKMIGVDPLTVAHVHVIYAQEKWPVKKWWECSLCKGRGFVPMTTKSAKGRDLATPEDIKEAFRYGVQDHQNVYDGKGVAVGTLWQVGTTGYKIVRCPKECIAHNVQVRRGWSRVTETQYQVFETRDVIFTVGYPQWSPNVVFDSRFRFGKSEYNQCELCAKAIPSGKRCPIEGTDAKGTPHGLYVGQDCAQKFTGTVFQGKALDHTEGLIIMETEFKAGLKAKGVDVQ